MISLAIGLLLAGMQEQPLSDLGPRWSYVDQGEWVWFSETDDILALVPRADQEPASIAVRWEEIESDLGVRSREMTFELDCDNRRGRLTRVAVYAEPNLNALIEAWTLPDSAWIELTPGGNLALLADRYC